MTRSTIKLRPQEPEIPERKVRLRLPGRLAADLDDYCALYARAHGQEIELPALIESILDQFLASDRAFQRQRRGNRPAAPPPAEIPSGVGVEAIKLAVTPARVSQEPERDSLRELP